MGGRRMEVILTGENSMDVQVGDSIITKNRIPAATALSLCCAWNGFPYPLYQMRTGGHDAAQQN